MLKVLDKFHKYLHTTTSVSLSFQKQLVISARSCTGLVRCSGPQCDWSDLPLSCARCKIGPWYVSNVFIILDCSMLLYYHSWMFYNHFIATLYHFLGLTYWHSAQCQLLHVFYIAGNQYQTESKRSETFCGFFMDQKTSSGPKKHLGAAPRGAQPTRGAP